MVTEKFKARNPLHYFDRVKIFIPRTTFSFMDPKIKNTELIGLCSHSKIRDWYMGATLDIELPNKKCFPYLLHRLKNIHYYISYLEISTDFLYRFEETAIKKVKRAAKTINIKYINHHKPCLNQRSSPDERFFTNDIWYWGPSDAKIRFIMYTPYSKPLLPEKIPCIHTEWRLKSSHTIWKYAKVISLEDLADFNFDQFYRNQCRRMQFLKIDHQAHGFYLLNPSSRNRNSKDNRKEEEQISREFCREKGITHPVHLKNYYMGEQKSERRGQSQKASYYKVSSFLQEAKVPNFLTAYI